MGAKYFGAAVRRLEDPRFLRGEGRFVDDVTLPGVLPAAFRRSPHAHATLVTIRTDAAKKKPGVVAVFTHADLARWMKPLPLFGTAPPGLAAAVKFEVRQAAQYPLAKERVRYVGEIVAMVVADDRGRAEDAVEAIAVEYAPHPAAVDMLTAGEPGAPLVHPEWGTNVAVAFRHGIGDADRALAGADVVLEETFRIQRYVGMPLERRARAASDPHDPARRQARRHHRRPRRSHLARPRRLQRLGHRAPLQHGRPPDRALSNTRHEGRRPSRGDEQDAERSVSRRRPAGDRVRDGPRRRLPGPHATAGSRRRAPQELHSPRRAAVRLRHAVP